MPNSLMRFPESAVCSHSDPVFTFVTHLTNETVARENINKTVQKCVVKFARAVSWRVTSSKKQNEAAMNIEMGACERTLRRMCWGK